MTNNQKQSEGSGEPLVRGPRVPGDDTTDLINTLMNGGELDADPKSSYIPFPDTTKDAACSVPDVILQVLNSPAGPELLEVAKQLAASAAEQPQLVFYTPVGEIKCKINWRSCTARDLERGVEMFFVKLRTADMVFTPKAGAIFDIGFSDSLTMTTVVCLAPPLKLYSGVDLLCFLTHNTGMEKNGKLKEDAPSVVSGKPSDTVVDGEPVVKGEVPVKAPKTSDYDQVRE